MNKYISSSNDAKLSDQDLAIVKAIEASGRYKLWGWEVPDFCVLTLIFDDTQGETRMGVDVSFYPIEPEEEE